MIIFFCTGVRILKLYLLCSACISSFSSSSDEVFAKSIVTGNFSSSSISMCINSEWFRSLFKWLGTNQTYLTSLLGYISTLYVGSWDATILHGFIHWCFNLARSLRDKISRYFYHQRLTWCLQNFLLCVHIISSYVINFINTVLKLVNQMISVVGFSVP